MTMDLAVIVVRGAFRLVDKRVIKPLVRAFYMVMSREFFDGGAEVPFAERDHFVQAF